VRLAAGILSLLVISPDVQAQGLQSGDGFVAARVGANLVGNTYRVRQSRALPGEGISAGVFLSPYWAAEFEVWRRAGNPDCCVGRQLLFSISAERLYARAGFQPYLAGGLTLLQSRAGDSRADGNHLQVQVTAGVRIPLVPHLAVDLDLRGNGGGSTMIVRPTVAGVYFFR
jgi:hypothetical protein